MRFSKQDGQGRLGPHGLRGAWALRDKEVFLGKRVTIHEEAKLVAAGPREDELGQGHTEVDDFEPVANLDRRHLRLGNHMVRVQIDQGDVEPVTALCIRDAEVEAQLTMLEGEDGRLQVREDPDETFFMGETILDDGIAYEKGINTRCDEVRHEPPLEFREAQEEKRTASRTEWKTERPATHTPSVRQRRNQTWGLPTASHRDQNSDIARPPWGILASEK